MFDWGFGARDPACFRDYCSGLGPQLPEVLQPIRLEYTGRYSRSMTA